MGLNERIYPPIHPGEILAEEFLEPMGIPPEKLAEGMGVPVRHVREIVRGHRRVDAEMATRLAQHFGMSTQVWLNLQARYE